jgi:hypothetical protein
MDHRSFRDQLAFSIGFAVTRSRELLRRILKEHAPDDAPPAASGAGGRAPGAVGFRDRRSRAGYAEAAAEPEPRLGPPLWPLGRFSLKRLQRRPGALQL